MAAASTTLHAVEKLQVRLATKTDPKKLGEISAQTLRLAHDRRHPGGDGNPKTVKSLRKHQDVGHFARDLAARWKKPLLVNPNTRPGPDPQDREESSSQRLGEALQDQETPGASQKMRRSPGVDLTALSTQTDSTHNTSGAPETSAKLPSRQDGTERKRPRTAPGDSGPHRAPPSERTGPLLLPQGLEPEQQAGRGQADAARGRPLLARGCQGQPQAGRLGATARAQILPPGERRVDVPGRGQSPLPAGRHPPGPAPEGNPKATLPGSARDRPPSASAGTQKEGGRHGGSGLGLPPGRWLQTATRRGLGADTHTGRGRGTHGLSAGVKQQLSSDPETQERKPPAAPLDATSVGSLSEVEEGEEAEELEQPTLSFEQYLAYDQVQKKEKRTVKSSGTARGDQQRRTNRSKGTRESRASPLKLPPVKESHSERLREAGADSSGRETVLGQGFSELWDLSEPWMQANYDLLSAFESMTSQPQTETARSAPTFQDETGASGGRVNAKMQVYSGSRPARQPQGLTLRQQCVRALRDNPDVLGQVGRVPSWVLHLVLEGCTPDQLYRREKNNHALIGETDGLWRIRCLQDFKEKSRRSTSLGGSCTSGRHAQEQRLQ
ncbi:Elongin-A2 [Plecturocebus cupreus]